ncbi:MAG: DUF4347 domain-containing protein [Cyanobacteria bacterium P01_A01_bin.37]
MNVLKKITDQNFKDDSPYYSSYTSKYQWLKELGTQKNLSVVVIDPSVENYRDLLVGLQPNVIPFILLPNQDGIHQITQILSSLASVITYSQYSIPRISLDYVTLHIVAHGAPGTLYLGNTELSLSKLQRYTQELKRWFAPFSDSLICPSLSLYACNVAAGDAGEEFINKLHCLTGANIAASTTRIGNAALGGNWLLDVNINMPTAIAPFDAETLISYSSVLATSIDTNGLIASYQNLPTNTVDDYTQEGKDYNFQVGAQNDLVIEGFNASHNGVSESFSFSILVDQIKIQRKNNSSTDFERDIFWYERESKSSDTLNFKPSYSSTLEEVLGSNVINRGADNLFANSGDRNVNNIERVDFVATEGLSASSVNLNDIGFLLLERGGNDPLKIAPITAIDGTGTPTSFGTLTTVDTNSWGRSQYRLGVEVLNEGSNGAQPTQTASITQRLYGAFLSYQDLGITADQTFFGYAVFPNDVNSRNDLVGLIDFPTNTSANSGQGGLDLVAGGGIYTRDSANIISPPIATNNSISGTSGNPVTFNIVGDDTDRDGSIDASTVDLDPLAPGRQISVTEQGQGTWSVDDFGIVTFIPVPGFTGDPTPITYTVNDNDGNTSNVANIAIDYNQLNPTVADDNSTGHTTGSPTIIPVLDNDSDDGSLDPATIDLNPSTPRIDSTVVTPGEGTWTVDSLTGVVTFTPEAGFTGDPTPITYTVADNDGLKSNAGTITVDYDQTLSDNDGDGISDVQDLDDDNDGILDTDEGSGITDTDGDGVPDSFDLDTDNDGILDVNEAGHHQPDANGDGKVDGPVGSNGVPDIVETVPDSGISATLVIDTDSDGVRDFRDLDADNDGISDVIEGGGSDPDRDGIIGTGTPIDSNGDGLADDLDPSTGGTAVSIPDLDGDGTPDYTDLDSDNDGRSDLSERGGLTDTNNDGKVDGSDSDGDGLLDAIDGSNGTFGTGSSPMDTPQDRNGNNIPDFLELPYQRVSGSSHADDLEGTNIDDILNGFSDVDILNGGAGNDIINGGSSSDTIHGGIGNDIINGGSNSDYIDGGAGNDIINGGSGNDVMFGHSGTDIFNGGAGRDRIFGGTGNDVINGSGSRDRIFGGKGRDTIRGGSGDDTIVGGFGKDILMGGQGRDHFIYGSAKDFGDKITDFEILKDKIDLRKISSLLGKNELTLFQRGHQSIIQARIGKQMRTLAKLGHVDIVDLNQNHFQLNSRDSNGLVLNKV